ncbi:hypothetical protein QBC41DRAFT_331400 [Cercophora samala]|uniref:Uncharacterized protein n=1 Tax=Cercophora samala TaxID=330535 RepID=A0AA39YXA4_9PEZI|nr:hypothetical protein QBC41DRAFT_331400 [Cercophora samala]
MTEMDIDTGDDLLRKVALDGSMDYSGWPALLPELVARIEKIANTEFPIPRLPPPRAPVRPPSPRLIPPIPSTEPTELAVDSVPSSQETNKENSSPPAARPSAPVPPSTASPSAPETQAERPATPDTLPKPVQDMLDEITSVLKENFAENPPHTIQRLSELVLRPRQHYKSVIAWLHALDRVVHVTSGANVYPLPPAIPDMSGMSLSVNGSAGATSGVASTVGTDEALGGALLTPIPWLTSRVNGGPGSDTGSETGGSSPLSASGNSGGPGADPSQHLQLQQRQLQQRQAHQLDGRVRTESTETIEGPNGMGRIETVSISVNGIPSTGAGGVGAVLAQRGVTQGELLRQEQRAGVVPISQLARQQQAQQQAQAQAQAQTQAQTNGSPDEDSAMSSDPEDEEEIPHARGPEEIGAEDTGPQPAGTGQFTVGTAALAIGESRGINVEAAVGRPPDQTDLPASKPSNSDTEEAVVPQSPKREATDELEGGSAVKKVKEDAAEEEDDKKDAEGDLVLPDSAPASESEEAGEDKKDTAEKPQDGSAESSSSPKTEKGKEEKNNQDSGGDISGA